MTADATQYRVDLAEVYVDGHGRIGNGEPLPADTSDAQLAGFIADGAVVKAPAQAG